MTRHTITVEKTVEEDQTVYSCNGCGLEVEEEAATYLNDGKELHLHPQCEEELLATSEPDFDTGSFSDKLPRLALRERTDPYVTAVKYIVAFAILPVSFVHVNRFIDKHDDNPEGAVFFLFCLWLVAAFIGALVVL